MKARELGQAGVVVGDRVALVGDVSGRPGSLARIVRVETAGVAAAAQRRRHRPGRARDRRERRPARASSPRWPTRSRDPGWSTAAWSPPTTPGSTRCWC